MDERLRRGWPSSVTKKVIEFHEIKSPSRTWWILYVDGYLYRQYSINMKSLDASFAALSDPTRRAIVARLAKSEATVGQLVDQFDLTQPTISSHLKVLEKAGLILRGKVGQTRPCRLNPAGLRTIAEWISEYERFWGGAVDRFVNHAETLSQIMKKDGNHDRKS